ncbi:MAG: cytidine deaminase [Candidatus Eremiobacteraeota bacterium]|nr:cytidine deaminase [Candidatus Eremiobacteraeota bacterium]
MRAQAYAPYSEFFVGAALQTADDSIFTGVNVENASLGLSMCAERVAACAAVTAGHRVFRAIAVAGPVGTHTAPCGSCRQFLAEFNFEMSVTYSVPGGAAHVALSELLPDSFKGETLRA